MKYLLFILITLLSVGLSGCVGQASITGITPIYPGVRGETVKSLQPTLRWKPSENLNITYDVVIYEIIVGEERSMAGPLVIRRSNLPNPSYKVEKQLKPNTNYFWSVRIRQGNKVSRWSRHNYTLHAPYTRSTYKNQFFKFMTPDLSAN